MALFNSPKDIANIRAPKKIMQHIKITITLTVSIIFFSNTEADFNFSAKNKNNIKTIIGSISATIIGH